MNKTHLRRVPFYLAFVFCLGLCNLVLREFVVILDGSIDPYDPQHMAEHGGIPDPAHIHDHEHDFVSAALITPYVRILIAREIGNADLPVHSRALAPLIPPPKGS